MRKFYPLVATFLIGALIGILTGVTLRSEDERRGIAESLFLISKSVGVMQYGDTDLLIKVFKRYEENHEAGADFLKRMIAIKYDKRSSGLENLFKDIPSDDLYYENNLKIEEFLKDNPLRECSEVPEAERTDCSIENRIPKSENGAIIG